MFDQRGEFPLLPFGNPIGFVPASRGGVYIELKYKSGANTVGNKCFWKYPGYLMGRPPARAVLRNDNLWVKFLQGLDGRGDDRLEDSAG